MTTRKNTTPPPLRELRKLSGLLDRAAATGGLLKLLRELFTPSELHDLALRLRLLEMLHGGVSQRKIAAALGISLCKVTRGSRILKDPDSTVKKLLR